MATVQPLVPDLDFKRRILASGAHDLSACYQCGTCSVVCPLSTAANPFPRKEMVWVQWGLKDRLVADPAVWLCHQCGACTTYCPRDAKPADVMAALRDYNILHYAVPRFMGAAIREPRYLPFLFAFPAALLLIVIASLGHLTSLPAGTVVFSKFLPVHVIENFYDVAVGIAALVALLGGIRYWRALGNASPAAGARIAPGNLQALATIFRHLQFKRCQSDRVGTRPSYKSHLFAAHAFVFYGFLGLVLTTASVGIGIYAFHYLTPWPLWHPVKILGNLSGLAVIAACSVFLVRRIRDGSKAGLSTYTDWLFLTVLALTVLTGYLSEATRLSGIAPLAYWTYFVHLVFVFFLLVYLPYSKFAHLVYRSVAMLHPASRPAGPDSGDESPGARDG